MNELEMATTEDLIDELARRHDGLIFATVGDAPGDEKKEDFRLIWRGGVTLAIGLANRTLGRLIHHGNS